MFDKMKQIKQLRALQKEIQKESFDAEVKGVKVVVNGALKVEEINLNPELDQSSHENAVREAINDAMNKAQTSVAQKMSGLM